MEAAGVILGLLALVVAWLSWRAASGANRISNESNEIARRALSITETEHLQREQDRLARGELSVAVEPGPNHEVSEDGAIWSGGGTVITTLVITITNAGDRATGVTLVDVWMPSVGTGDAFWAASAGGPEVTGLAKAIRDPHVRLSLAAGEPVYDSEHLSRKLDRVVIGVPERLYIRVPLALEETEHAYPVDVVVRAEGADEVKTRGVVRIRRR